MPRDLAVTVPDRPGTGALIFGALGDAGINVEGVCGFPRAGETWTVIHVLVQDGVRAKQAIEDAGFEVRHDRDVLVLDLLENRPGILGALLKEFSERGVNIDLIYMATGTRLVIGTSDMHDAMEGVRTIEARFGA